MNCVPGSASASEVTAWLELCAVAIAGEGWGEACALDSLVRSKQGSSCGGCCRGMQVV